MYEKPLNQSELQLTSEQILAASANFLDHFGVNLDPHENPEQFLEALKQFDPRFEGDRNLLRYELEQDQREWPEDTKAIIMQTAEAMRMLEAETPLVGYYDVVIALGGARQSNLDRTRYAAEASLIVGEEQKASFKHLIVAGSSRKLNESEQQATANYAPGATTEFDLCAAAAKVVAQENPGVITSVLYVEDEKAGTPIVIEKVLSSLKENGSLKEDSPVAAVTTQLYQVSTELDLARVAKKFGIESTFTAGNPSDPELVAKRTPATYLSEIIRTLRAATLAAQAESE